MVALIGLAGCSFIGVRSKPTTPWFSDGPAKCEGYGLPVADTVVATVGIGLAAITGFYASQATGHDNDGPAIVFVIAGLPALGVGLIEAAAASYGFNGVHRCRADQRATLEQEEPASEHKEIIRRAWTMERAAAKAALDGDCETVARIDVELRALDAVFHDTWLGRDAAIQRCLAGNVPPSLATPAPPPENP